VRAVIDRLVESRLAAAPQRDTAHLFDNNLIESAAPQKLEADANAAPHATPAVSGGNPADLLAGSGIPTLRKGDLFASTGVTSEPRIDEVKLEVLDAASRPESPVSPNRATISMAGGVAGLIAGLALARRRRG
jgi:hypothetical protein